MEGRWIALDNNVLELFSKPAFMETFVDILICTVPIWVAVMIGLLIGWSWRPRWSGLVFLGFRSKFRFIWTAPLAFGARRFWFAFTALSTLSVCRQLWFRFRSRSHKQELVGSAMKLAPTAMVAAVERSDDLDDICPGDLKPATGAPNGLSNSVTEKDLGHLLHLLDGKNGEMSWQTMMEHSTSNIAYQAWQHEPKMGPMVYRTKTIFEDATPNMVRDFFWDDEFRPKWDPMLSYFKILEECPDTGIMIVHWIKKFPFFCSDREYVFGRRIWEAGRTYYCVTKGVPYLTLPRRNQPKRVDLYFSSWVINPVQSRKGDGQLSACEVIFIHYEDMGIPKDVAKFSVRHGMWGTVKKLHTGFRAYQNARKLVTSLTRYALMARITTKMSYEEGTDSMEQLSDIEEKTKVVDSEKHKDFGGLDWKWLAIGGTVALVCGLQTGLIGKVLLIGAGHRIVRRQGNTVRR